MKQKWIAGGGALFASLVLFSAGMLQGCVSDYSFNQATAAPGSSATNNSSGGSGGSSGAYPGGSSSGGTPSTCTPQQAKNLRILFMVDASGSTQTDDPQAVIRTNSALNFINSNLSDSNLSFSYSYFACEEPSYDYSAGEFSSSAKQPFGSASQAVSAVNGFASIYPGGVKTGCGTNYQDALSALSSLVTADNAANPGVYSYAVIFMSDGEPTTGADTSATIDPLVTSLLNTVGTSRMTLSTVYFSQTPDSSDEGVLDNMAIAGNGQYVNGNSSNLSLSTMIQAILTVPSDACQN
jgi:hypothetical protein